MTWYDNHKTVINSVHEEWCSLLNSSLSEHKYHNFLSNNAGLFLGNPDCHLVISKLKLGSELETDFVTLTDGFSNGNVFELIEIKQPSAKLFTERGILTADFNRAIQQIRDWKRWLIDNRSWMKKYLPTISTRVVNDSNLKFKIIIGRRLSNIYELEKRNQIAEELGADIRSFDYLSDRLKTREIFPIAWTSDGIIEHEHELANPFFKATSDSEWKKFCQAKRISDFHFYSYHYKDVIKKRKH